MPINLITQKRCTTQKVGAFQQTFKPARATKRQNTAQHTTHLKHAKPVVPAQCSERGEKPSMKLNLCSSQLLTTRIFPLFHSPQRFRTLGSGSAYCTIVGGPRSDSRNTRRLFLASFSFHSILPCYFLRSYGRRPPCSSPQTFDSISATPLPRRPYRWPGYLLASPPPLFHLFPLWCHHFPVFCHILHSFFAWTSSHLFSLDSSTSWSVMAQTFGPFPFTRTTALITLILAAREESIEPSHSKPSVSAHSSGATSLSKFRRLGPRQFPTQGTMGFNFQVEDEHSHLYFIFFQRILFLFFFKSLH